MARQKARFCLDCRFHIAQESFYVLECRKGHKPRFYFYAPKQFGAPFSDWGWKRRCDDFEEDEYAQGNQN